MTKLGEVKRFLDTLLQAELYDDVASYYGEEGSHLGGSRRRQGRTVERFGLALEPQKGFYEWAERRSCDALFLHRPWAFRPSSLSGVAVLAYHLAFDEALTLGYNPRLADALSLTEMTEFGHKEGRPIGMVGTIRPRSFGTFSSRVEAVFGGYERQRRVEGLIGRVAVVGAMTKRLIREAAGQGATLYLTGQWRAHAEKAVEEQNMAVITVGHERSEQWGLELLASLLKERFPGLETHVFRP